MRPTADMNSNEHIRFEPHENPPPALTFGAGLQAASVILAPVVLTVVIVARIAEQPENYISWAVFAALAISGATTVLQAVRVGRVGAAHVLIMGTSGAFIAVCVAALVQAGPATMASLIVVSSLFQFALAARLALLRRIFTPIVSGTVIMLIGVTVMPILFDTLQDVPADTLPAAAPIVALVTLITVAALVIRGPPAWRLWSPLIGVVVGCAVSAPLGLYDAQAVLDAPWFGVPLDSWPGFDLTPGPEFWGLLPAFVMVTMVGAVETIGDAVAIQTISRRRPRATDFRLVQGALNADGVGNLLSGIAGTMPNTTYSTSISLAEVTGIAARRVGVVVGVVFFTLAFLPKVAAMLIAIPGPVAAAYIAVLVALLFVQGMRIIVRDGLDHRKATVVGLSFWIGVGFQNQVIFPDLLGDGFAGILLGNGMTAGALTAFLLMSFMEMFGPRRQKLQVNLEESALGRVDQFLREFAKRRGWNAASTDRLASAGEETLAVLLQDGDERRVGPERRLVIAAHVESNSAELEFTTALAGENMQDQLALLGDLPPIPDEREAPYRLLRHYASSVRHHKYHDADYVTVIVDHQT